MKTFNRAIALVLTLALLIACAPTAFAGKSSKKSTASKNYDMPYYIEVDIANQITTVYSTADNSIVRQMICTTGMGNRTPRGTYIMPATKRAQERGEWYYFPEFKIYAKYASRIIEGILFHSILFSSRGSVNPTWASSRALGSKASHGCIRLRVTDAKWIAENCFKGTQVRIFDDGVRDSNLRALLKISTFSVDDEVTYDEFLAGAVTLSNGANIDSVTQLQKKLNELGYDCGKADGYFGTNTEKAVLAWQHDFGYEETGVVSPELLKVILASTPVVTPEPAPTPDVSELTGVTAKVKTKTWLNVRSEPDTSSALLTTLKNGKEVTVIYEEDGWYQIKYGDIVGFVSSAYLTVPEDADIPTAAPTVEPTAEPTPEPIAILDPESEDAVETVETTEETEEEVTEDSAEETISVEAEVAAVSSWLNVRPEAKIGSTVLAKLHSGDKVEMTGVEGKWARIKLKDGTVGYVLCEYLIYDTNVFPAPADTTPEGIPATVNSADGVHLRREPKEDGGLITTTANKSTVYIQEELSDGWVKVYACGFTGYMLEEYLTRNEDTAA